MSDELARLQVELRRKDENVFMTLAAMDAKTAEEVIHKDYNPKGCSNLEEWKTLRGASRGEQEAHEGDSP